MEKEIKNVIMLPARFLEVVNEEKIRIKIMLDDGNVQERTMSKITVDDIINPDYLFVGIITGVGHAQLNVCDASEYKEIFEEKWSALS